MPSWTVVWDKHDNDVPQATCVGNVRSWSCGVRAKLVSVLPFSCAYGRPVLRFSRAELQWSGCSRVFSRLLASIVVPASTWLRCTEHGDLRHIGRMPDKAQRELSASVVSLDVHAFQCHLEGATHVDATRRLVNWRSVCDSRAIGTQCEWDRTGRDGCRMLCALTRRVMSSMLLTPEYFGTL